MEILEKIKHLEENIKILNEIKASVTFADFKENKRYEWEVRYGLFESIQIIIDISCKISATYNLGNPKNYKECIELLAKFKYTNKKLSKKVVSMVGLRNLLVHEYAVINDNQLFDFLNYLDDFILFANKIKREVL